jgi:Ca-activated chloride channel family protein
MFKQASLALTIFSITSFAPALASENLLFILDASGSMWGKVDNSFKIETAKNALVTLVSDLPADTKVGLMVYGHREKTSCADVEMLLPVGHANASSIREALSGVKPLGKTPIAYSLEQTADQFIGLENDANNVVLISDGVETCDGDPCAVAAALANSNIKLRVHVVGFDIPEDDKKQLECIAELGNGQYFSADSTEGFVTAVTQAIQTVQTTTVPETPPAPQPTSERVFFDDFDGSDLAQYWDVENPDKEAYLVEDGNLLLFSGHQSGFSDPEMKNVITLTQELPDGDWDAIIRFSGELSSGRDQLWVGFRKDSESYLSANLVDRFTVADDYHGDQVWLNLEKRASGEETKAPSVSVFAGTTDQQYESFMKNIVDGRATLVLSKRGRSYSAALTVDGVKDDSGQPVKWETDKLTSLRSPGPLTIGVSLYEQTAGEILAFIDSVEIVKISN